MTNPENRPSGPVNTEPPYRCLLFGWSVGITVTSILIGVGLKAAPIQGISPTLDKILWPSTWDGWVEKIAMLLLTIFLMLK